MMEGLYDGAVPALAVTFLLFGEGFFLVFAFLRPASVSDGLSLERLGGMLVLPCIAILLGVVAAWFGFQDQGAAAMRMRGSAGSLMAGAFICSLASFAAVAVYAAAAAASRLRGQGALGGSICWVCGAVCAVSILVTAALLAFSGGPWPTWSGFAAPVGFALLCGTGYAVVACEGAKGFPAAQHMKRTLVALACIGAVLGLGGFIVCTQTAAPSAAAVVEAAMMQVTLAIFALTAAAVFSILALRSEDTGYYSIIAFVAAVLGTVCALIVLLAL